jgi:hypothetical protein
MTSDFAGDIKNMTMAEFRIYTEHEQQQKNTSSTPNLRLLEQPLQIAAEIQSGFSGRAHIVSFRPKFVLLA